MKDGFFKELRQEIKPLDNSSVLDVEKKYNIKFPESYLELLRFQNGGYLNYSAYPIGSLGIKVPFSDDLLTVRGISGIRNETRDYDLEENTELLDEWELDKSKYVTLDCDGHWWICFDKTQLNQNGEPKIVHIELEYGDSPVITVLSDNFQDFINKLKEYEY
ncbi:SMI1/KNR4 family protein [Mesonia ostreae]|uniref:SMI1/KNR4 family protein n=1 Tax=Mesonia ostreae TaxID=861110 RepID=A0ABU2KML2_9FLAO|nr:SMI1/KNR4 family protein [Mesonia ostreae]MDT0295898.1 SMI1/KNR4 family protein [Mesonia ostreae]